jgi:nucleoside-diphosphate-sugar epimerase
VTVLLAGGAGFLGPHLAHRLLAERRDVEIVDDLSRGRLGRLSSLRGQPGLRFHRVDIRSPEFAALVRRRRPAEVVHLAATLPPDGASGEALVAGVERAWLTLVALLEAVAPIGDVRVVLAGTSPHALRRGSLAGVVARAQLDTVVATAQSGVDVVALALPVVYGPGEHHDGGASPVARLLGSVTGAAAGPGGAGGGAEKDAGDGGERSDEATAPTPVELDDPVGELLYVDDAVDALTRALGPAPLAGSVVTLGSGSPVGVLELVDLVAGAVGRRPVARRRPREHRAADVTVASRVLGWRAFTPLADGLRLTLG